MSINKCKMKILVTGANGYLGQGIVRLLLERNVDVIATDFMLNNVDKRAKCIACNLFDIENPYDYFDRPDKVLHLAWRDGFVHNSNSHINDLRFHYEFINKLINGGLKKIAIMGTMHEVGFFEGPIKESTPCFPQNNYGVAKNALRSLTEILCNANDVELQWLRAFYIVGNYKNGNSIFTKIYSAVLNGEKIFPFTSGKNQYDFIDYDEFCEQVVLTILQDEIDGIINICSGSPEKLGDKVEQFIAEHKFPIKLGYGIYPERAYDSKAIWGDSSKIEQIKRNARKKR